MHKYISLIVLNILYISASGNESKSLERCETHYQKYFWIQQRGEESNKFLYTCNFKNGSALVSDNKDLIYFFKNELEHSHLIKERFVKCNNFKPNPISPLYTNINFFKGNNQKLWKRNLPTSSKLSLGKVWKGIEVILQITEGSVEKTFIIAANGGPDNIQIELTGINRLSINNGNLRIEETNKGEINFSKPIAWQIIDGKQVSVDINYNIQSNSKYGFSIGNYNKRHILYIDPVINSTYIGGAKQDKGQAVTIDKNGDIYVVGTTYSDEYPTSVNAYTKSKSGDYDIFISKFDSKLETLIASTYIGGDSFEIAFSINIDINGNIVVSGGTYSNNYPTTINSFDETYNGNGDGFVTVISNDLSNIIYSTFIGGDSVDQVRSLDFDKFGNIFITGFTFSSNFPTTVNAFDKLFNGIEDIFISKFSFNLKTLTASTLIGGNDREYSNSIKIGRNDDVYIGATSVSSNFPNTLGSFSVYKGNGDIVISKFDNNLSILKASTCIGGTEGEVCSAIEIGTSDNIFIGGYTLSSDFPVTKSSFDTLYKGGILKWDICISKLNPDLTQLMASTYFGGGNNDLLWDMNLDIDENLYFTGWTFSSDFPLKLPISNFGFNGGGLDVFISKLNKDLNYLIESVYIGGALNEMAFGLILDSNKSAYITGLTSSINFPVGSSSYDNTYNGNGDAFIAKYKFVKFINLKLDTVIICKSDSITLTARKQGLSYLWSNGNTVNFTNINGTDSGWFVCTVSTNDTVWSDSTYIIVLPLSGRIQNNKDTAFCEGMSILLSSTNINPSISYKWNTLDTTKGILITKPGIYSVNSYDGIHCSYIDEFNVNKHIRIPLTLPDNQIICEGGLLNALHTSYNHYLWNDGSISPSIVIKKPGLYVVTADNGICFVSDSTFVSTLPKPVLHLPHDTIVCFDELRFITLDAGEWKTYTWYPTGQHSRMIDATFPAYYRVVVTDSNNCEGSDTALVDEKCYNSLFIPDAITPNGDNLNDIFVIRGRNIIEISIKIYNRIGGEVFSSSNIGTGWDGKYDGQPCPLGVYFYEITYKLRNSGQQFKIGTITLLQ